MVCAHSTQHRGKFYILFIYVYISVRVCVICFHKHTIREVRDWHIHKEAPGNSFIFCSFLSFILFHLPFGSSFCKFNTYRTSDCAFTVTINKHKIFLCIVWQHELRWRHVNWVSPRPHCAETKAKRRPQSGSTHTVSARCWNTLWVCVGQIHTLQKGCIWLICKNNQRSEHTIRDAVCSCAILQRTLWLTVLPLRYLI